MLVPEFPFAEITGATERDGPGVTEHFPLPLRGLYRERGVFAVNTFAADET